MTTARLLTAAAIAADRYADLIHEHVVVTFSDGGTEAGILDAAGWDTLAVLHTEGRDQWQALYSLTGDADTPHVVSVTIDQPQTEALL
jgi:hypothetical protein